VPLLKLLGFVGAGFLALAVFLLGSLIANSGFSYLAKNKVSDSPVFVYVLIYTVALAMQVLVLIAAVRLLKLGADYALPNKFDFFHSAKEESNVK
jgi:hypothetical protein